MARAIKIYKEINEKELVYEYNGTYNNLIIILLQFLLLKKIEEDVYLLLYNEKFLEIKTEYLNHYYEYLSKDTYYKIKKELEIIEGLFEKYKVKELLIYFY